MFEIRPNRSPVFTTSGKKIVVQQLKPCANGFGDGPIRKDPHRRILIEGGGNSMAPKSSRSEIEEPGRSVKVIVIGEVAAESFGEDSRFEIHRCEDVSEVTR